VSAGPTISVAQYEAFASFIAAASESPAALIIEGEAGIGKTTRWLAAINQAREQGFAVLAARAGQAESVLAYAALADLLNEVDDAVLSELPDLQRLAVDRVLFRAGADGPPTDQWVAAAAFTNVIERLAAEAPLLVSIDDVQWLDPSSQAVITYAARRLKGRVGFLFTERCEPDKGTAASWLHIATPDTLARIRVHPLSIGGLHNLLSQRLGRTFPRPTIVRIAETSGGNPFYALELARAMENRPLGGAKSLPATLAELVRIRLGRLQGDDIHEVLLAAASVAAPTVELLARATDSTIEHVVELLEEVESHGILEIDGNRLRFAHPLLAHGVYDDATPARKRAMHRALAAIEALPELRARHLALSATTADEDTLQALDQAGEAARSRGAPAAAAELADLAIRLGGDTDFRRIRGAEHHFRAGNVAQAAALLEPALERLEPGPVRGAALITRAILHIYDDGFNQAAELLTRALDDTKGADWLRVPALLYLSFAQVNSGEYEDALHHAREAVGPAESLGIPMLTCQVLAILALVTYLNGYGVDEETLQRALELEQDVIDVPIPLSPSANNALILAFTGRVDEAYDQMVLLQRRCIERGDESEAIFVAIHSVAVNLWRGSLPDAALAANESVERAEQLDGDHMRILALTTRAGVAAFEGRAEDVRVDINHAFEIAARCGARYAAERALDTLAYLEGSLQNYPAALAAVQPFLDRPGDIASRMSMFNSLTITHAIAALVGVGRLADAEPLVESLEVHGRRTDHRWLRANGARCRSMLLAAQGDIEAAEASARQALAEYECVPIAFERAQTLLLLGQIQRRRRQKESAAATLREALRAFEDIGMAIWVERTRNEMARIHVKAGARSAALTPAERRVAELAASGLTNRDVGAALFISPKTVEHNLSRVYRKLGIRSRAELGRRMSSLDSEDSAGA
jgi:DNA-binding NarL/FixJ family response regulator